MFKSGDFGLWKLHALNYSHFENVKFHEILFWRWQKMFKIVILHFENCMQWIIPLLKMLNFTKFFIERKLPEKREEFCVLKMPKIELENVL